MKIRCIGVLCNVEDIQCDFHTEGSNTVRFEGVGVSRKGVSLSASERRGVQSENNPQCPWWSVSLLVYGWSCCIQNKFVFLLRRKKCSPSGKSRRGKSNKIRCNHLQSGKGGSEGRTSAEEREPVWQIFLRSKSEVSGYSTPRGGEVNGGT